MKQTSLPIPSDVRAALNGAIALAMLFMAAAANANVPIAVNLTNRTFSDVNRSSLKDDKLGLAAGRFLRRELWFYMLFAAIALISVEWFTYHRRITL